MGMLFKNNSTAGFYIGNNVISRILFKQNVIWENGPVEPEDDLTKPLTFTATGDSSVQLKKIGSPTSISLEYSYDEFKTNPIPYTIGNTINLSDGQSVSMRAVSTNGAIGYSWSRGHQFIMSGSIAASGNIQSLLDKTGSRMDVPSQAYFILFDKCTSLTKAPILGATTLSRQCYEHLFSDCTSLTEAPVLKITSPADGLWRMFDGSGITEFTVDMTACTSVPSLTRSTLFTESGVSNYTVLVPLSLYDSWITATNWSTIASNIQAV